MKNFTIYKLKILNNINEEQVLDKFNGVDDLFKETNFYYQSLRNDPVEYSDTNGNKRTFSISSEFKFSEKSRTIIADLDSAYTGEKFEIRNGDSNSLSYSVSKNELQSRKMFSVIFIPKNAKNGYVVFENKSKHGVKIIFEREFNKFLRERGFLDTKLIMTPGLNFNYLSNMIEKGKLKKVRLIDKRLAEDIQYSLWGDNQLKEIGEDIRELKFTSKIENSLFKKALYNMFFSKVDTTIPLKFMGDYKADEISFEINYNNSSKTFYIKDRSKMRSNIDVTNRLEWVDEEATESSKFKVAKELINEVTSKENFEDNELDNLILEDKMRKVKMTADKFLKFKNKESSNKEVVDNKSQQKFDI